MEKKILNLFLYNHKLKFNEIEKELGIRSNKLAYHLKNLVEKGILDKRDSTYKLSKTSEHLIPYISEKNSALPVLLIRIGNEKSCFLHKRKKRPFKGKLSLPGGRLKMGETIEKGVKRIMKNKFDIKTEMEKINSISLEHVKKEGKTLHSFLLIFVDAKEKENVEMKSIEKNRDRIISSDYKLLKENSNKETEIEEITTNLES